MNNVFQTIFELIINLYEAFMLMNFVCSSLSFKRKSRKSIILYISGAVGFAALITVLNLSTSYEGLLGVFYSVYFFVFSLIFLKGSIIKKFFISVFTNVCLIFISALTANLMSVLLRDEVGSIYSESGFKRVITVIIVQAVLTYVFAVLHHFISDRLESLKPKEWGLVLSVLGISFVAFAAVHITAIDKALPDDKVNLLMITELGILLINIVCWYMTVDLSKRRKREEELLIVNRQNEYAHRYSQTVKAQYDETRRLRHDMKQYSTVLSKLIADQKYGDAQELISQNYKNIVASEMVVDVGNDFVNAILNAKLQTAKSCGIGVICSAEKNISGIEAADLCNLIGNLLDNAIEAAQKCALEKRSIEFNMSVSGNHLSITVRNSIVSPVLADNPKLLTTKAEKSEHGFGLKTVEIIVKKYNGTTDFYEEGLTFSCHIILKTN